ncbi:MAG: ABC transporter substrate-binding protein, partial [Alphaproteobacteria bacterium]|nr:ABC transporter substrate-binding protein [Alphaproteobacteria bacterium]
FAGICDPAIDALTEKIAQAQTREDLVATAHTLDRAIMAGHYMIPLYYAGQDFVAYKKRIRRPTVTPLYGAVLETWWDDETKE